MNGNNINTVAALVMQKAQRKNLLMAPRFCTSCNVMDTYPIIADTVDITGNAANLGA